MIQVGEASGIDRQVCVCVGVGVGVCVCLCVCIHTHIYDTGGRGKWYQQRPRGPSSLTPPRQIKSSSGTSILYTLALCSKFANVISSLGPRCGAAKGGKACGKLLRCISWCVMSLRVPGRVFLIISYTYPLLVSLTRCSRGGKHQPYNWCASRCCQTLSLSLSLSHTHTQTHTHTHTLSLSLSLSLSHTHTHTHTHFPPLLLPLFLPPKRYHLEFDPLVRAQTFRKVYNVKSFAESVGAATGFILLGAKFSKVSAPCTFTT
jgi:hypothetical protein